MIYPLIKHDMKNNLLVAVLLTAVVVGGGSFYAGMKYSQSKTSSIVTGQGGARFGQGGSGGTRGGGRFTGGGMVSGKILSVDGSSITVEMRAGAQGETSGSKIVLLSSSTQVMKAAQGTALDLSVGEQVTVMGTANPDGSVTAQSVQIRPNIPERSGTLTPENAK